MEQYISNTVKFAHHRSLHENNAPCIYVLSTKLSTLQTHLTLNIHVIIIVTLTGARRQVASHFRRRLHTRQGSDYLSMEW